jgi:glucose/arabinose dehydrogenase
LWRNAVFVVVAVAVVAVVVFAFRSSAPPSPVSSDESGGIISTAEEGGEEHVTTIIAEGLDVPWDIAFLPDGRFLVTERSGRLLVIAPDGTKTTIQADLGREAGEGGLLGLTLHPDFEQNGWVYLYMTAPVGGGTENRVERYRFENNALFDRRIIMEGIPGAAYHDGGRIEFGLDGMLYITTGDAGVEENSQDRNSLAGKILRLSDDGSVPDGNPFASTGSAQAAAVWSYGHRNPQGLAWDGAGRLWSTEHGRSGIRSGLDEINVIRPGENYGWPQSEGDTVRAGTVAPVLHSGANTTWAPASAAYLNGSLFFGGLRGEALYEAVLDGTEITEFKTHFKGEFGRIRTVRVGPPTCQSGQTDCMLYLTTSNRDGRGQMREGDDRIIRVNPALLP